MKGVKRSGSTKLDCIEKATDTTYQSQNQKHYDNEE